MDELWGLDSAVFGVLLSSWSLGTSTGMVVAVVALHVPKESPAKTGWSVVGRD